MRKYKLASTLFDGAELIGEADFAAGQVPKARFSGATLTREQRYIQKMAEGLCLRQMPFSQPRAQDIVTSQFEGLKDEGLWSRFREDIDKYFLAAQTPVFAQTWGTAVQYIGNPAVGMLYIEFWTQVAYIVMLTDAAHD